MARSKIKIKKRKPRIETETWLRILPECYYVGEPSIRVRRDPGGPGVFQIKVGTQTAHLHLADLAGALDEMGLKLPT